MSDKPKFVYVIYIAATPEKVFAALTDGNASVHYWHGTRIVSDWKVGAPFLLKLERGDKKIVGKIAEYEPPRRLACTFQPHFDGMDKEAPSHVAFDIERQKDQVIVHDGFEPDSKVFEGISGVAADSVEPQEFHRSRQGAAPGLVSRQRLRDRRSGIVTAPSKPSFVYSPIFAPRQRSCGGR